MVEWWSSPTPVDADFIRRQRRDAAAIPLRVWLAVLDQGLVYSDLQSTLPRLTAPMLLIWGGKDPIMGEEARQTLRAALPQAQVKVFEGLGHNPFWEDPQGVRGPDQRVSYRRARSCGPAALVLPTPTRSNTSLRGSLAT